MADNLDILNATVSFFVRAALLATRFSGRAPVKRRTLGRRDGVLQRLGVRQNGGSRPRPGCENFP
jgi:hypothetical protein